MKAIKGNSCNERKEKPFPKLMRNISTGSIFLMTNKLSGTRVFTTLACSRPLGTQYNISVPSLVMEDYNLPITLCND